MEALKVQVEENKQDIKEVKESIKEINQRIDNQEKRFEERIEKNHQEIKLIIKENELNNKEKNAKIFNTLDLVKEGQNKQELAMLKLNQSIEKTNEYIKEVQEKNKWLSRYAFTAAVGFCLTFINAVIQTFFI